MKMKEYLEQYHLVCDEENTNILIYSYSGFGKDLAKESYIEDFSKKNHKNFVYLNLLDTKKVSEACARMFKPSSKRITDHYQIEGLKKQGEDPIDYSDKCILYHIDCPELRKHLRKNPMQPFTAFRLNIKDILSNKRMLHFIFETDLNLRVIDLVIKYARKLKPHEDLKELLNKIKENFPNDKTIIKQIDRFIKPLEPYVAPSNFKYNLNVEKIIRQRNLFHIWLFTYANDIKICDLVPYFIILKLLEIPKTKVKCPILIDLDELRLFCPRESDLPFKRFTTNLLSNFLSIARGKNISVISSTQILSATNPIILRAFTSYFFGRLPVTELDFASRLVRMDNNELELVKQLPRNCFHLVGDPVSLNYGGYLFKFPRHYHANKDFDFYTWLEKENPAFLRDSKKIIDEEFKI